MCGENQIKHQSFIRRKKVSLKVSAEKPKYVSLSRHRDSQQNYKNAAENHFNTG
jgi:hypothetical protein